MRLEVRSPKPGRASGRSLRITHLAESRKAVDGLFGMEAGMDQNRFHAVISP